MRANSGRLSRAAYYYFLAVGVVSLLVVYKSAPHPHITIWTEAARKLMAHRVPEGLISEPTYFLRAWLYPPYAALFFAPLLPLPLALGQAIYITLSFVFFCLGLRRALRALRPEPFYAGLGLFFLVASSDLTAAVIPVRLELLSMAAVLWTLAWLVEGRFPFVAGMVLGTAASWKLQLVSAVGLTAIASLTLPPAYRRRYLAGLAVGALALPVLFSLLFPSAFVFDCYRVWLENMRRCAEVTWTGYQSIWSFTYVLWQWPADSAAVTRLGIAAGLGFAALVAWLTWRRAEQLLLVTMALGALYPVLFSPLSQGAGYLLGLLALLLVAEKRSPAWQAALLGHWVTSSLLFSDLVPRSWMAVALKLHLRPVGFTVLLVALIVAEARQWRRRRVRAMLGNT